MYAVLPTLYSTMSLTDGVRQIPQKRHPATTTLTRLIAEDSSPLTLHFYELPTITTLRWTLRPMDGA